VGGRAPRRLLIRSDPPRGGRGALTPEAARWLSGRTLLVGTDELSIDPPGGSLAIHRILLGSGALILENLSLASIAAGTYDLIALPMRLGAPDGAPVRALIRRV
jgi:arylformamidase